MINELEQFLVSLAQVLDDIKGTHSGLISRQGTRAQVAAISKQWLQSFSTALRAKTNVNESIINALDLTFEKILDLSSSPNRKSTYLKLLGPLQKELSTKVMIPLIKSAGSSPPIFHGISAKLIGCIASAEERAYYEEAFRAAAAQCYKAAVVMTWCAVVDRLHSFVKKQGLPAFNKASTKVKNLTTPAYKSFNKEFNLAFETELQEVSEKDLLIVISGMVSMDVNELKAILRLLDTRNSCAHPSPYVADEIGFTHFLNEIYNLVLTSAKLAI
jgi:hypothetical protein